jgi:glucokinase
MHFIESNRYILGADIGGSHITAAIIDSQEHKIINDTLIRMPVDASAVSTIILGTWAEAVTQVLQKAADFKPGCLAFAMPGPFNYEEGISLIKGLHKYDLLYGINVKDFLSKHLNLPPHRIWMVNDAQAFLEGEIKVNGYSKSKKVLGVTLGTGLGTAISYNSITTDMNFAMLPFLNGIAEEYLSTRWFVNKYNQLSAQPVTNVKDMLMQEQHAILDVVFNEFTHNFSNFLIPIINRESVEVVIIGGNIAKAEDRFLNALRNNLNKNGVLTQPCHILIANVGELSAMIGAALQLTDNIN